MLTFKPFQLDDIARLALTDGAILAHEQGMGKSLEMLAWALIKQARRVLIVAPGELHEQHKETAQRFFGLHLSTLDRIEQIHGYRLDQRPVMPQASAKGSQTPRTRFWITTFHALGYNHADEGDCRAGAPPASATGAVALQGARKKARLVEAQQLAAEMVKARMLGKKPDFREWFTGIGAERQYGHGTIRCVWRPTLSRVLAQLESFDCVLVDEGTAMQGMETHLANGVCRLNPRYRLVLTGTPIKNRVESAFRLMLWATGGSDQPSARFPYAGDSKAKEQFANDFLEHDRFLSSEEALAAEHVRRTGKKRSFRVEKRTARLCNVHRWWKLAGPIILRRRKDDCGLDLVPKIVKPIKIPAGTAQLAVYQYHLEHPPLAAKAHPTVPVNRRLQLGMQLTTLRLAALCPHAGSLADAVTGPGGPKVSYTDHNPKSAACLSLIADQLDAGEQVLVGSPFNEFNETLHRRLIEAGVTSVLLNGSVAPAVRGKLAASFKRKEFSVIVAGLKAMGLGHSFECCSRLILPSFSYAMDENEQFIHRIWRLNSPKPVEIFILGIAGTIDEVVMRGFDEKLDSAQLALDGRLLEERVEEVDTAALLAAAVREFDPAAETIDERQIERQWETVLRDRLRLSEARFREHWPRLAGGAGAWVTSAELHAAVQALALPSPTPLAIALARRKAGLP